MTTPVTCTKGSDASCNTLYGAGACCFYVDVITPNDSPNASEQVVIDTYKTFNFPVDKGQSAYFCADASEVSTHKNDKSNEYTDPNSGIQYKGYCASAVKQVALAAGAVASILAMASF